jgi:hypothetical protein
MARYKLSDQNKEDFKVIHALYETMPSLPRPPPRPPVPPAREKALLDTNIVLLKSKRPNTIAQILERVAPYDANDCKVMSRGGAIIVFTTSKKKNPKYSELAKSFSEKVERHNASMEKYEVTAEKFAKWLSSVRENIQSIIRSHKLFASRDNFVSSEIRRFTAAVHVCLGIPLNDINGTKYELDLEYDFDLDLVDKYAHYMREYGRFHGL